MIKIDVIIRGSVLEQVKNALLEIGIDGMTVLEVRGHGQQRAIKESYRGTGYSMDWIPKVKIEIVLPESLVDATVEAILKSAATGAGDGKIFFSKIDDAIRIRNEQRGVAAL